MQGHETFAAALEATRARNARVADKFFSVLLDSQRDAISLGQTMAAAPTAYGKNMEAVMQSMTAAQERALELAKAVYKEQAEATGELRSATEKALESAREFVPPVEKFTSLWTGLAK
jgi:adenylosuccinate lyase